MHVGLFWNPVLYDNKRGYSIKRYDIKVGPTVLSTQSGTTIVDFLAVSSPIARNPNHRCSVKSQLN